MWRAGQRALWAEPRPPAPPRSHTGRHPGSGWASGCSGFPPRCRCGLEPPLLLLLLRLPSPQPLLPSLLLPPGLVLEDWWGSGGVGARARASGLFASAGCAGAGGPCWPGGSCSQLREGEEGRVNPSVGQNTMSSAGEVTCCHALSHNVPVKSRQRFTYSCRCRGSG